MTATSTQPDSPRPFGAVALRAAAFLFVACLALWIAGWAAQGSSAWPRFEDDAYYYLAIARNVAAGHGFSADGISPTNGFQPLWMWLLIPVAWLTSGDTAGLLAAAQLLAVLIFCVSGGLLYALLHERFGTVPALLGAAVLLGPRFTNPLVSGMESGIALLVFVCLWLELLRGRALERPGPALADARPGVLFGLLLLARLDAVFAALTCSLYAAEVSLRSDGPPFAARLRRALAKQLALFWPTVLLLAPYLAWNVVSFGHLMPISGALKTSHANPGLYPENLNPSYLVLLGLGFAAAAVGARAPESRRVARLLALFAAGFALQTLHSLVFMHWAVFSWHFALCIPIGAIAVAVLARAFEARVPPALMRAGVAAAALLVVATQAVSISRLEFSFLPGAREGGEWVAKSLPAGAVLGMKDSGAFGYFAERRVMNLDGVVNSFEFAETLCRGELSQFLARHGVQYIAQHSVPADVRAGDYDRFTQVYACHFPGGRDGALSLHKADEVYRGTPYQSYQGAHERLVIWRLRAGS